MPNELAWVLLKKRQWQCKSSGLTVATLAFSFEGHVIASACRCKHVLMLGMPQPRTRVNHTHASI